jgi:hypothetical protein
MESARRALDKALALAETMPHVMDKRLAQAKQMLQAGVAISHAS